MPQAPLLSCSWIPHSHLPVRAPQHEPTHKRGAYQRVPTKPSTAQSQSQSQLKGMLNPVNHPSWWILEEMDRVGVHPHWWKEIRASKKFTMRSGPRGHIIWENISKPKALHYVWWPTVAFRLPLTQQEASGWWDALPLLCGLCPQDFLSHANTPSTGDFHTVRQEKP